MNKYDMEKLDDLKETGDMAFLDSVPVTVVKLADCYEVRQNYSLHRTFYSSLAEVKRLIVSVGEDGCPYCGYKGCLSDIEQDVEGNVYVPEN